MAESDRPRKLPVVWNDQLCPTGDGDIKGGDHMPNEKNPIELELG